MNKNVQLLWNYLTLQDVPEKGDIARQKSSNKVVKAYNEIKRILAL